MDTKQEGGGERIPLSEAKRLIRGRHGEGVTCEAVYSLTVRPRVRLTLTFRRRENRVWKSSLTRASHLLPFPLTLLGEGGLVGWTAKLCVAQQSIQQWSYAAVHGVTGQNAKSIPLAHPHPLNLLSLSPSSSLSLLSTDDEPSHNPPIYIYKCIYIRVHPDTHRGVHNCIRIKQVNGKSNLDLPPPSYRDYRS